MYVYRLAYPTEHVKLFLKQAFKSYSKLESDKSEEQKPNVRKRAVVLFTNYQMRQ